MKIEIELTESEYNMRKKTEWRISKIKTDYENLCYVERDHEENGKRQATERKLCFIEQAEQILKEQPEYI